jgi:putative transcriptional regulator
MTKLFRDFMQGMNEIREHEQGKQKLRVDKVTITLLEDFSAEEIKQIRNKMAMSQRLFASIIGVSVKTIEAWEAGKNKPSGSSVRMLQLINTNPAVFEIFYSTANSKKRSACKV